MDLIEQLAEVRSTLAQKKAEKKSAYEEWETENAQLLYSIGSLEAQQYLLIDEIRKKYEGEAVIIKNAKGEDVLENRQPHPAIKLQLKDATVIEYDQSAAFEYCLRNLTTCLTLDAKSFEAQAKTGKLPAAVVTVKPGKRVFATIASEL